jgi:hypothetical protein
MHLLLTKFHMYLENIILHVTNTNTWKISPRGAFQCWFRQNNKGDAHQINSKWAKHPRGATHFPWPAMWRRWRGGSVRDRPLPRGGHPLAGTAQPPLHGSVPPQHVEVVECMLHAKYSFKHRLLPYINRWVPPLSNTPHTPQHLEE